MVLGFYLRVKNIVAAEGWQSIDRLIFYVLFPSAMIWQLAAMDLSGHDVAPMLLAALSASFIFLLLLLMLRRHISPDDRSFTAIVQGSLRFNVFVGLALGYGFYGADGMELAALMIAVMTLPNNFISVFILSRYGDGQFQNWRSAIIKIIVNPNILGCLIGLGLYAAGIALPKILGDSLKLLGQTALPMALLSIGAGLRWHVGKNYAAPVVLTNAIKLILLPVMVWAFCHWFGVGDLESRIAVLYTALPSATTSYVMSRQMGGHPELMAGILSSQCLLSMLTIPLILWILFHGV